MKNFKNAPLIGITSNIMTISEGPFQGHGRLFLNRGYVDSVLKAGGIPVILPMVMEPEAIRHQLSFLHGLIFSGGQDVQPSYYKEDSHPLLGETAPERDTYEYNVLCLADELQIPLLGICRGLQFMNVYFGGTLHQDLTLAKMSEDLDPAHVKQFDLDLHEVTLTQTGSLSAIFNASALKVNSYHHQAINEVAPGWEVTATSADGLIEGIGKKSGSWQQGVQWHPEVHYAENAPLFVAFIQAALQYSDRT
jgi:putative glutamine amidotransferase